jgi:lipopolysaccharide transport system ATP-binding protein
MYVRLAFAVAAHLEPEILVVDEVLAVGDAEFQKKCLGKMKDVATGGRTVLFVSHNMGAIKNLCQRVLLLKSGRKEIFGSVDETIRMYLVVEKNESGFRPNLNKPCHILETTTLSVDGKSGENFMTNEPLTVRVKYYLRERTKGARVGFSLINQDGVPICACSPEDEGALTAEEAGSHVYEAVIPSNTFLKGVYQVQAGLWNGLTGEIYDQPGAGISIQVEAAREKAYARDNFRPGSIQLRVNWKKA